MNGIAAGLERMVSKGKIFEAEATAVQARTEGSVALSDLASCDLVIEAATEHLQIKRDALKQLDLIVRPDAIFATNTSSVSVTKLGATLSNPGRFTGLHFFNPVPIMELVEVIRGLLTSATTFDTTIAFAKRIGKTPIDVKNSPGFVVNQDPGANDQRSDSRWPTSSASTRCLRSWKRCTAISTIRGIGQRPFSRNG
ncbi:Fatty acid oxidation complex subunit alpha [Paraburkholderia gardini]|uniref:Fatty acid oxidation complex subunit alpha n=1 Tax=Paraburkholderia gardini TaxID=2823469 RepID=A0ABM8UBF8_9BURK|nr:Fatty acid oxidation complex subunit alpha [Paraburkholderia gardini]